MTSLTTEICSDNVNFSITLPFRTKITTLFKNVFFLLLTYFGIARIFFQNRRIEQCEVSVASYGSLVLFEKPLGKTTLTFRALDHIYENI
jgi:hypothetical protein